MYKVSCIARTSHRAMNIMLLHSAVPRVATEQVLTETDVVKLMKLIHNFSDKWNEIGLELGFTQPELNQIKSNPSLFTSAPASFLTELLTKWVQWPTKDHPTKPILGVLCEALRSSLVELGQLAEKVEKEMKCYTAGKGSCEVQVVGDYNTRHVLYCIAGNFDEH